MYGQCVARNLPPTDGEERSKVMTDRFTEAYNEIEEKNPYVCTICSAEYGHPTIEHFADDLDVERRTWDSEDILDPDPIAFGD